MISFVWLISLNLLCLIFIFFIFFIIISSSFSLKWWSFWLVFLHIFKFWLRLLQCVVSLLSLHHWMMFTFHFLEFIFTWWKHIIKMFIDRIFLRFYLVHRTWFREDIRSWFGWFKLRVLNSKVFSSFECLVTVTIFKISSCIQRTYLHRWLVFMCDRMLLGRPTLHGCSLFVFLLFGWIPSFNLLVNNIYEFYFLYLFYFYVIVVNKFWENLNALEIKLLFNYIFFFLYLTQA